VEEGGGRRRNGCNRFFPRGGDERRVGFKEVGGGRAGVGSVIRKEEGGIGAEVIGTIHLR